MRISDWSSDVCSSDLGYDPAIDSWKGGEALPVPVQRAMSVTWQDTPVVLGGWRTEGANPKVATDKVWRVVNSRLVELPQIGRASCRERVCSNGLVPVGRGSFKKKKITRNINEE